MNISLTVIELIKFRKSEKLVALILYLYVFLILIAVELGINLSAYYFYFIMLFGLFIFNVFILSRHRNLIWRMLIFGGISFILGNIVELTSVLLNLWVFPSDQYIATVDFYGHVVPVEEILWWFVLPVSIATLYEVFADTGD